MDVGHALESPCEGTNKLSISTGSGGDQVHGSCHRRVQQMEKGPDLVFKGDPRPPLPAVAEAATKAHAGQGQHPPQSTAIRGTHDAGSS